MLFFFNIFFPVIKMVDDARDTLINYFTSLNFIGQGTFDYVEPSGDDIDKRLTKYAKCLEEIREKFYKQYEPTDEICFQLQTKVSQCGMLCLEGYFTLGAMKDVVVRQQDKIGLPMTDHQYLDSLIENFGDTQKVFSRVTKKSELSFVLLHTSKYIARVFNAAKSIVNSAKEFKKNFVICTSPPFFFFFF